MARRTFFSFHYADIMRANVIRNCNVVLGCGTAGFFDHSEYEEAKKSGDAGIKRMIDRHLDGTSVTVVLIGTQTALRRWVRYEIEQSVVRGNGLLGVYINLVGSPTWPPTLPGPAPHSYGQPFPTFPWKGSHNVCVDILAREIERAGQRSDAIRRMRGNR